VGGNKLNPPAVCSLSSNAVGNVGRSWIAGIPAVCSLSSNAVGNVGRSWIAENNNSNSGPQDVKFES